MLVNAMVKEVHETAKSKGWWDGDERPISEVVVLAHSELSEAIEAARDGLPAVCFLDKDTKRMLPNSETDLLLRKGISPSEVSRYKPEGIAIELADCVIRIMDYFGYQGWDLEAAILLKVAYNKTRPHKHGGKAF